MRAAQFISELEVAPGIVNTMTQKGYQKLGSGQDQLVFLEPGTGQVLKIFGTNRSGSAYSNKLTFPQQTFKAFADFCAAHPDNQFLPQFSGWETFEYGGQRYLQIRCERLFPGTKYRRWFGILEEIADEAENWKDGADDYLERWTDEDYDYDVENIGPVLTLLGGKEGFYKFWDTIYQLGKIADRNGFHLDLHDENFMLGSDGEFVISDPFFSGWGKRDR